MFEKVKQAIHVGRHVTDMMRINEIINPLKS